jgi:hypothetical protein
VTGLPHLPAITRGVEGGLWCVYCLACSDREGDWVPRCRKLLPQGISGAADADWPQTRLLREI